MSSLLLWEQPAASFSQWLRDVAGYQVLPPFKPKDVAGLGFPDKMCRPGLTSVEGLQSHRAVLLLLLLLLAGSLLFFLPHPLLQLLANISQRVHFGRKGLHCVAKPAGLCLPATKAKHTNQPFRGGGVISPLNVHEEERVWKAAYRSLRFWDCFIWLKSVGSGLFTGLKGGHNIE